MSWRRRLMMKPKYSGVVPVNEIWYDAESQVELNLSVNVISHTFADGRGVIRLSIKVKEVISWLSKTPVTRVYLPDIVEEIGASAFFQCSELVTVNLPDGLKRIKYFAFFMCRNLAITELPANISVIESQSFIDCTSIPSLTIRRVEPPALEFAVFSGTFPFYVPAEAVNTYKAASGWSDYASRIFAIPSNNS